MQDALTTYFNGEKNASLLLIGLGIIGLAAAVLFVSDAARFFSEEAARMARVQRNFVVVPYIEVAVIVAAAIIAFAQRSRFWVAGVALGLLLNAALLLAFDLVAERRGALYVAAIETQARER